MSYCDNCCKEVDFVVKEETLSSKIKGKIVKFKGKSAYCIDCGEYVFVDEIEDSNIILAREAFRKLMGIISIQEINNILDKYQISKRPLSLVLGWGELTLTRFYEGFIPTIQYSDALKDILYNPKTFLNKLKKNKNLIKPRVYEKSFAAVSTILKEEKASSANIGENIITVSQIIMEQTSHSYLFEIILGINAANEYIVAA